MGILELSVILIVAAAAFGVVNYHIFKLPPAIGVLVGALISSMSIFAIDFALPALGLRDIMAELVSSVHFDDALLEGMLTPLLFAGAMHVCLDHLKKDAAMILLVASLGVCISTGVIGWGLSLALGMPLLVALVFGAIISPTDPVAVMGVLKQAKLSKSLETRVAGESLFNDGVAYVVYLVLVTMAWPSGHGHAAGLEDGAVLFIQEALGGAALGAGLGFFAYQIIKKIDDFALEVLITLALAFGGYMLSHTLHVSAPIAAVISGLFIGNVGMRNGMSDLTRQHVDSFWKLIDEILNAVLFVMIGFEIFVITITQDFLIAGALAIGLGLLARGLAVVVPMFIAQLGRVSMPVAGVMTWGGLKGGISIALALALPDSEWKPLILTGTYIVVVFSIMVQGLSIGAIAKWLMAPRGPQPESAPAE